MRQRGELDVNNRALIVVKPAAMGQWQKMVYKCLPEVKPQVLLGGKPTARRAKLQEQWTVGYHVISNVVAR